MHHCTSPVSKASQTQFGQGQVARGVQGEKGMEQGMWTIHLVGVVLGIEAGYVGAGGGQEVGGWGWGLGCGVGGRVF